MVLMNENHLSKSKRHHNHLFMSFSSIMNMARYISFITKSQL